MDTGALMYHPTENRALTPEDRAFVEQCAREILPSLLVRASYSEYNRGSKSIVENAWGVGFEMLDYRNKLMTPR